eukprot:2692855-Pyramimonas_sp.AAC.1
MLQAGLAATPASLHFQPRRALPPPRRARLCGTALANLHARAGPRPESAATPAFASAPMVQCVQHGRGMPILPYR